MKETITIPEEVREIEMRKRIIESNLRDKTMNVPNEIEQKADKLINWIRIEIGKSYPEYDSDVVDDMVLVVIRKARRMIEKKEK